MCGFIGRIKENSNPNDLFRGLPFLKRRGPDSQRLWFDHSRSVCLLHARLSIVDHDPRAHQPFTDNNAKVTVAFVGEIYNYQELRRQFAGYPFVSESDTEIILAAYTKSGIEGLSLLKGMYALVIVDEIQQKVLLARDSIGKKPLFLANWGNDVLFGSSLISIAAVYGKKIELNPSGNAMFWEKGYINPSKSVIVGAAPVLPGKVLELSLNGKKTNEYHISPKALYLYHGEPISSVREKMHELFLRGVNSRLKNNSNPTALLSGGIDSTVVVKIAKEMCDLNDRSLQVLTLGAVVPGLNDELYAYYAAWKLGTQIRRLSIPLNALGTSVIEALDAQDEPLGMISYFTLYQLVKVAKGLNKILLTGDGGDEVFLGYGKPSDWYFNNGVENRSEDCISCGPDLPPWMTKWAQHVVTNDLVGHMFAKADRASAEQGVEIRCPLLDWDLVCYARSLPYDFLLNDNKNKAFLKDMLSGWPSWFKNRSKIGFRFNIRWLWRLSGFDGLRESIDERAVDVFKHYIPDNLKGKPSNWKNRDIFTNFPDIWKLMAWSRFLLRLDRVCM